MEKKFGGFPRQTLSYKNKTKKWAQECVDAVENVSGVRGSNVRQTRVNKMKNFMLWNGVIDKEDIKKLLNPKEHEDSTIVLDIQHNPILIGKFNVLIGEEARRKFEPQIIVTNPDAISEKEIEIKQLLDKKIYELLENEELTDDQKQAELAKYNKRLRTDFQTQREIRANRFLKYLTEELRLKKKFNDGFKNRLICAEEIYEIDAFGGKLEFNVLNPMNVHTIMSGESNKVQDADIIVIETYRSPGQLIDRYYDKLNKKDVEKIETYNFSSTSGNTKDFVSADRFVSFFTGNENENGIIDNLIDLTEFTNGSTLFGSTVDSSGNIRELRVLWRSRRKMLKVEYPNPDTGDLESKIVPETYVIDKELGEDATVVFINEWWEGTKIGRDIYVNLRPKPIQYFRMENPSLVHPGIVGSISNTNGGRGISMMDRLRGYQYLYDVVFDNLKEAFRTNLGPILEMDFSKVPEGWTFEKWLYYMKEMRIAATDSFKEGNRGAAQGKLAGNFNTTGKVFNLDLGNYIQQMVLLLQFIETQIAITSGVTKQREGQIENRETVGGVERSVQQSSSITESLFLEHEETQIEAVRFLIEAAKYHYKGKKVVAQFILDDGSIDMLDMDGDEFADADYDVLAVSGTKVELIKQKLEQAAQMSVQSGSMTVGTLVDIIMSPSMMDMKRTIKQNEEDVQQREQERFEEEQETQRQAIEQAAQAAKEAQELKKYEIDVKSMTEIEKALIMAESRGFEDNDAQIEEMKNKREQLMSQINEMSAKIESSKEKQRQLQIENEKQRTKNKQQKAT
jgi:hypothetical protein